MITFGLLAAAFTAGVVMFFAPCTLPLVPAYLGYISGVSLRDAALPAARRRMLVNAALYVIGFSVVFVALGTLAGLGGRALIHNRLWLSRVGGLLIVVFGLSLLGWLPSRLQAALATGRAISFGGALTPGRPLSSFLFGAIFALGWTPCVGPVLGSVLLLAATTGTVGLGALLLSVFALGMALPFLLLAAFVGQLAPLVVRSGRYFSYIAKAGGALLVLLGLLLMTDTFGLWIQFIFRFFSMMGYERIIRYL